MQLVHLTVSITQDVLRDAGLDAVRATIQRQVKTVIAERHPGYAADELRCVALYHWPHPEQAGVDLVTGAYLYTLIHAPLSA